jgi:hypothetical protein
MCRNNASDKRTAFSGPPGVGEPIHRAKSTAYDRTPRYETAPEPSRMPTKCPLQRRRHRSNLACPSGRALRAWIALRPRILAARWAPQALRDPLVLQDPPVQTRLLPRASQQRVPFASSRENRQRVASPMKRSCPFSAPAGERPMDRNAHHRRPSGSVCGSNYSDLGHFPLGRAERDRAGCGGNSASPFIDNVRRGRVLAKKVAGACSARFNDQISTSVCGQKAPTISTLQLPGSLLKMVIGKSTCDPVSGTAYFCQPTSSATATTEQPKGHNHNNCAHLEIPFRAIELFQ